MNRFHICTILLIIGSAGCRSLQMPEKEFQRTEPVDYTVIYLIHGDANYLYHNSGGNTLHADWQVLAEAKQVAQDAEKGEVFIFHLKPESQILWVFPKKDRRFLYYRKGELVYEKNYSPGSKKLPFVTETKLYHRFHQAASEDSSYKKIALYFGHEIPARKDSHYYRSRPEALFNTALFAEGLENFLQPEKAQFDLSVISTCANGTPQMVEMLSPITDYILASPQNLHLSHIETNALQLLEHTDEITTARLADSIATQTYSRLSSFLQTVITLSVYDTERTQSYIRQLAKDYQTYLTNQSYSTASGKNTDCARLAFFNTEMAKKGIKVWYKAPQFGKNADISTYSGWGCRK